MDRNAKIYVAGHRGLVGSAILANLRKKGFTNILVRTHSELDLTNQAAVNAFFADERPEYVFLAAAHVGGIWANHTRRADFIYLNLMIQSNVIEASRISEVRKLLFLGSTCIYPRQAPQPMREDYLLTSPLEYTNEPYAIAKIAGIKMCESYNLQYGTNYIAVMPTNLYGPNDNFDPDTSHVLPAMIRKLHWAHCLRLGDREALRRDLDARPVNGLARQASDKEINALLALHGVQADKVSLWGTGKPLREFLWSEDMADACVHILENVNFADLKPEGADIRNTHINIGTGREISIRELAGRIQETIGYGGALNFDASKPDGTLRKLTDVSKLHALGWHHRLEIKEGIERLYQWYLNSNNNNNKAHEQ
ncbi:MAG: GDP-L-fucose synthase [Tannerellaceae bacterium]|jgi:GDP-L-fucose synthase|nr:GDP-L-fucose synthase [Tannerellaceae bacterium]